jgi:hypothetical protein
MEIDGKTFRADSSALTKEEFMFANALILTIAILLALGFWLMNELKFLIPYKHILFRQYGAVLLGWLAVVFVNLFAGIYAVQRKFFLKDTGRKLSHIDQQITAGHAPVPAPDAHPEGR